MEETFMDRLEFLRNEVKKLNLDETKNTFIKKAILWQLGILTTLEISKRVTEIAKQEGWL